MRKTAAKVPFASPDTFCFTAIWTNL